MAKYSLLKNSFTAGQLSPLMNRRSDQDSYRLGAKTIQNFTILPQGGVTRRLGSVYVNEVKTSAKSTRLLPFEYSTTQAYVVETGETYFRFFTDDGRVESGGSPVEVTTPYQEADLFDLAYTQSADVMTIVHPDYAPRDLTRTTATSFTLTQVDFQDGPYLATDTSGTTLSLSATSGTITLTASASLFAATDSTGGSGTGDYDRLVRILDGSTWRWLKITAYTNATTVTAVVQDGATFSGTGPFSSFRLGAYSSTTGFPRAITYHQQRLFLGGTTTEKDKFWGSAIDDFTNFAPGTDDDNAVSYVLADTKVNAIYWMTSSKQLRIGTEGGMWSVTGGSDNDSITPTNVEAEAVDNFRCKAVSPIQIGQTTLFLQRNGKVLRQLGYSFEDDTLIAPEVTLTSENILGDVGDLSDLGATQMSYQLEPYSIVWVIKSDGELAGLQYLVDQRIIGWHNHVFGGTDVAVESISTMPITGQDRVWVIVKRTINGSTVRYVEKLDTTYRNRDIKRAVFIDSAKVYTGTDLATTLTPSDVSGSITLTAGSSVFSSGDVGRIIRIQDATTGADAGAAEITAYTSGTVVTATVTQTLASSSAVASGDWTISNITYTGLDHLEGESVTILADGGTHSAKTVSSGSITLDNQATWVTVGLGYTSLLETMDFDEGNRLGTAFGFRGKVVEVELDLFESSGGYIGYDTTNLNELIYRTGADLIDEGVPNYTGVKKEIVKGGGPDDSMKVVLSQSDPLPFTCLSLAVKGEVSELF